MALELHHHEGQRKDQTCEQQHPGSDGEQRDRGVGADRGAEPGEELGLETGTDMPSTTATAA